MFTRHLLVAALAVVGPLVAFPAHAQSRHVPRVAAVHIGSEDSYRSLIEAQRQGLSDLGVREGDQVIVERYFLNGQLDRIPALYAELGQKPYDIFMGSGFEGISAAQAAAKGRVVVGYFCGNDVVGMVGSLARPGSNTTGVSCLNEELALKRLELLHQGVPTARHIAYLYNPSDKTRPDELDGVREVARRLGLSLVPMSISEASRIAETMATARREGAEAIVLAESPFAFAHRQAFVNAAQAEKLPGMYFYRLFVIAGGTFSYGPDPNERARELYRQVARIVKGAKVADLPVDQPTRFELVINRASARAIGLTISDQLAWRADEVID
jgi:putative tryptophan/tyrosine transport system substrate-binding protein